MLTYALTTFLSAFLLFLVQPMIAKRILPWFGGTPAVWTTCMLFFQVALLGGYAYAHWLTTRFTPRRQALAHLLLLLVALPFLPIYPGAQFKPPDPAHPAARILVLLALTVLAPYFVLSATSPLLQRWFSLKRPGRSPYALYALSNTGSMLALPLYVVLFEPALSAQTTSFIWSGAFVIFALLCAVCAFGLWKPLPADAPAIPSAPETDASPQAGQRWLWLSLPFGSSLLLLAVTNELCQNIAVAPFLWVLPLGLYLLSFILAFANDRWYRRVYFWPPAIFSLALIVALLLEMFRPGAAAQIAIFSVGLFSLCMICHGELARLRPTPAHLTRYYLTITLGGALGAVFVALIAPTILNGYFELDLGLWGCAALGMIAAVRSRIPRAPPFGYRMTLAAGATALILLGVALALHIQRAGRHDVAVTRNFYGVLRVKDIDMGASGTVRVLQHGTTLHGWQFAAAPERRMPTAYYGPHSGVGLALRSFARRGPRSVAVVGLGIGTLAAYGRPGDEFRFLEINPAVADAAARYFDYLSSSPARCQIVMGDARLSLERDDTGPFDLLVLDAFTSDSVPAHLLTREAFAVYLSRLRSGGVIAINISNNYLDLEPVVRGAAEASDLRWCVVNSTRDPERITHDAIWMLLSSEDRFFDWPELRAAARFTSNPAPSVLWSDDRNNLFTIFKWRRAAHALSAAGG